MWILPSHTSVYAPDTEVLTSASDESLANVCGQLLTVKSKPSRASYFSRAWRAGNLTRLRSGLISALSLGKSSPECRSSRAASRVPHSVARDHGQPTKIQGTCSRSSSTASGEHDLPLFSWKTSKASSRPSSKATAGATPPALRFCSMCSESWSAWVTAQRRDYSRRLASVLPTQGSAPLSWPTASARDSKGGYQGGRIRNGKLSMDTLDVAVQAYREGGILGQPVRAKISTTGSLQGLWPTTSAGSSSGGQGLGLSGGSGNRNKLKQSCPEGEDMMQPSKLNPRFCEVLMGLPVGWTMPSCAFPATVTQMNSAFSATESSPSAPPSPSPNSLAA